MSQPVTIALPVTIKQYNVGLRVNYQPIEIVDANGNTILRMDTRAPTAEAIVTALNAQPNLIDALKGARDELRILQISVSNAKRQIARIDRALSEVGE